MSVSDNVIKSQTNNIRTHDTLYVSELVVFLICAYCLLCGAARYRWFQLGWADGLRGKGGEGASGPLPGVCGGYWANGRVGEAEAQVAVEEGNRA